MTNNIALNGPSNNVRYFGIGYWMSTSTDNNIEKFAPSIPPKIARQVLNGQVKIIIKFKSICELISYKLMVNKQFSSISKQFTFVYI